MDQKPLTDFGAAPLALATQHKPSAELARDLARSLVVDSHEQYEQAAEYARAFLAEHDRLDALRKSWTGPLLNVQRSINGAFSAPLEALKDAAGALKEKMAAFQARLDEERRAAVTESPGASPVPFTAEAPGVSIRTRRAFEITDPDLVPRQFCSPDPAKIKAHMKDGGLEAIRGVRFYDEPIVSVRRNG